MEELLSDKTRACDVGKLIDDVVFHAFQIFDLNQGPESDARNGHVKARGLWRDSLATGLSVL